MQKLFILSLLLVAFLSGKAQFNTVTFTPSSFTAEDEVTLNIDLTGTSLAGETELYIWTWCNKGADAGTYPEKNGITTNSNPSSDWGNSPATAKMTYISGNNWSFTLKGIDLFGLTAGQLKHFQFLVKTKTGSKQSSDSPTFPFTPLVYVPSVYRTFPSRISESDAVSIYFDQNMTTDLTESRMTPVSISITAYKAGSPDDVQVGATVTIPVSTKGQKLYSISFLPQVAWAIPAGTQLKKFTYVVKGTALDVNGNTINVSGSLNTKVFDNLQ